MILSEKHCHVACDIYLVFGFIMTYASVKRVHFIWQHINTKSSNIICPFHCCLVSPLLPRLSLSSYSWSSCFPFVFFCLFFFFFSIHPQLSEQLFPCTVTVLVWVVKKFRGWARDVELARATVNPKCWEHQFNKKRFVYLNVHLCSVHFPPLRSSQRLLSRWTMKLWCFRERPRSTATPTETCCSAPSTMSRWVPLILLPLCFLVLALSQGLFLTQDENHSVYTVPYTVLRSPQWTVL